jgi:hypothetical protein
MKGFDVERQFIIGGKPLLDFLTFCVVGMNVEPLFAFLVQEFRVNPTEAGALALYDCFCAPGAPARLRHAADVLPPRNIRFEQEVQRFRERRRLAAVLVPPPRDDATEDEYEGPPSMPPVPKYIFDVIIQYLRELPENPILEPGRTYDPNLTPAQNLPGGRMTQGQRYFVDKVWQPRVRPDLVRGGFWKVATVG